MIGKQIRDLRLAAGLTQIELSHVLGFHSQGTVSMWERNERSPDIETIVPLADALRCTLDQLLRGC